MELIRTNKYRLYPSASQKAMLFEMFNTYRFVFNHTLGKIQDKHFGEYEIQNGKNKGNIVPKIPSQTECIGFSTEIKQKHNFVYRLANDFVQASLTNLYSGLKGFYRKGGYPKFKSRKSAKQSINTYAGSRVKIQGEYILLPRARESAYSKEDHLIRFKKHETNHEIDKITGFTIEKDNLDQYWIAITHKIQVKDKTKNTLKPIGIDLGLKDFIIDSSGNKVPNDNLTKRYSKKLSREQRRLSRKKKGLNNRAKQKIIVAKVHEKISNKRQHHNHTVSKHYVNMYNFISLESLSVKNMVKNRRLSKAISSVAWSDFVSKLKYKMIENQGQIVQIDKWLPSSKTCFNCGAIKDKIPLSVREYKCTECGYIEDRDINAAKNILTAGLKLAQLSEIDWYRGITGTQYKNQACGV